MATKQSTKNKKNKEIDNKIKDKKDKSFLIFFIIILIILAVILSFLTKKQDKIFIDVDTKCNDNVKYLGTFKNRKIYTKCIKNITINGESIDEIITIANQDSESEENKTLKKIYDTNYYGSKYSSIKYNTFINDKSNYLIIECNTEIDDEKIEDIYITPADSDLRPTTKESNLLYCTKHPYLFKKTYHVENIRKVNDDRYYITLSNENGDIDAISYDNNVSDEIKDLINKIEANKTYNFVFSLKDDAIDNINTIKSIVENSIIFDIEETTNTTYDEEVLY